MKDSPNLGTSALCISVVGRVSDRALVAIEAVVLVNNERVDNLGRQARPETPGRRDCQRRMTTETIESTHDPSHSTIPHDAANEPVSRLRMDLQTDSPRYDVGHGLKEGRVSWVRRISISSTTSRSVGLTDGQPQCVSISPELKTTVPTPTSP